MGTAIAGYTASFKSLVNFRAAYLRAIARCWSEEGACDHVFLDKFTGGGNILEMKEFTDLLPAGYTLPWNVIIKNIIPANDTTGFPLHTRWMPGPTSGWFGINDTFVINLPPLPTATTNVANETEFTKALSAYNKMFPTLMGTNHSSESEGLSEDFVNFSTALLQAIALCWATTESRQQIDIQINATKDPDQLTALNEQKKLTPSFTDLLISHGIEALGSFIGFVNPWGFNIVFRKAPIDGDIIIGSCDKIKKGDGAQWDSKNGMWKNLRNEICLNYPHPPSNIEGFSEDATRAVALAQYNADGMQYPFSCP